MGIEEVSGKGEKVNYYKIFFIFIVSVLFGCFVFAVGFIVGQSTERKYNEKPTLLIDKYYSADKISDKFMEGVSKYNTPKGK